MSNHKENRTFYHSAFDQSWGEIKYFMGYKPEEGVLSRENNLIEQELRIEEESDSSMGSNEFFNSSESISFSEEEEEKDKWSDPIEGESIGWRVPKIEAVPVNAKKKSFLEGSILKYTIQRSIFTAESLIVQMCSRKDNLYVLDRAGRLYIRNSKNEIKKIEIFSSDKRPYSCKDMGVLENGTVIVLRRTFPSFFTIDPVTEYVREIKVVGYKEKTQLRRVRVYLDEYMVIGGTFVCIYSGSTHLMQDKIDMYEEVIDAVREGDTLYILTEISIVKYSISLRQKEFASEVLVHPESLALCAEYLICGSKKSLSLRSKQNLQQIKDIDNLSNVSQIDKISNESILVYNSPEIINGMRMYNAKAHRVIKTFPPGKGLYRVTAFVGHKEKLFFAEQKVVSSITLGEKETPTKENQNQK